MRPAFITLILLASLLQPTLLHSQTPEPSEAEKKLMQQQEDARLYLETIDVLHDQPLEAQIEGWQRFLRKHPDSYFKQEIQANLDSMLARRALVTKKQEEEDSRLYFATIERAASYDLDKQIVTWEKFIKENPDSIFANEARTTLNRLKQEAQWSGGEIKRKVPPAKKQPENEKKKQSTLDQAKGLEDVPQDTDQLRLEDSRYLDPDKALFLAALPGLVIPGLGHFYAKSYAMGSFLAAIRLAGIGFLAMGAFRGSNAFILPGGILALTSYALDVGLAPKVARDYNYALDPLPPLEDKAIPVTSLEFKLNWTF